MHSLVAEIRNLPNLIQHFPPKLIQISLDSYPNVKEKETYLEHKKNIILKFQITQVGIR